MSTILIKRLPESGMVFVFSRDSSGRKRHASFNDGDTGLILVRLGWTIDKARLVVASLTAGAFHSEQLRLDRFQEVFLNQTLDDGILRDRQ
jgi:hypothetical protein